MSYYYYYYYYHHHHHNWQQWYNSHRLFFLWISICLYNLIQNLVPYSVIMQVPDQRWSSQLKTFHDQRCRTRRRSWYMCEEQSVIMISRWRSKHLWQDTSSGATSSSATLVLRSLVTQPWSSTLRNQRLKIQSLWHGLYINRYCQFTTRWLWNSTEQAYFISQLRGTHYITLREPGVRKEPVYASWRWQAPCATRHCCITGAHKNLSNLFTSLTNSVGKPDIVK